jgi:hypothetical protein
VLDDLDEVLRLICASVPTSSVPFALVVRRQRDELEDAVDVAVRETRFEQALRLRRGRVPVRTGRR